ncbi:hypothetical protein, partial [Litoreibacter albidus]|uniref:hypothetical protein n=1 Tax=Litoreibacter albidus TaxID=670155 RepID=UPI0037367E21
MLELVATMEAMAEGVAPPCFYLSSLDPGVGKTTTLIHFVQELLRSEQHKDVAVLLCFAQLEEIEQLVKEMGLDKTDFAVLTGEDRVNGLSPTPRAEARVLLTTHAMVKRRCGGRGRDFAEAEEFYYQGRVRTVRIWDEEMLPGEVVSLNTDQLAALRDPLRTSYPALAEIVEELELALKASDGKDTFDWPDIWEVTGVPLRSAQQGREEQHVKYLDSLYALSGRRVLLRRPHNAFKVITALDSRDAIPDDLAPVVILDASGRVRSTYGQWEKQKDNLVRLPSAVRRYSNLTVRVMDKGAGKTAWAKNGEALAHEVAKLIDSKPDEVWLVIYHSGVNNGAIPDQIRGLLNSDPSRVSFLNWGKHKGTNEFRHIPNVILAGLNNYSETDNEMLARYYSDIPSDQDVPKALIHDMQAGEHMHHILQALCRSALRQGSRLECGPCNAYIIASAGSRVRELLPVVFPGCRVGTWRRSREKPKGKVQDALTYIEGYFDDHPYGVLRFTELRSHLGYDASNFSKRIRQHDSYIAGLEDLGVEEVSVGNYRHRNALMMKPSLFGP